MKKKIAVFAILLASVLYLTSCNLIKDLFGPCDDVYFKNDELMVPTSCSSYSYTTTHTDANGCLISYNFSATGCTGPDYTGSVTFTRDAACNITSRKLVVNGTTCD
jgi:hypothetical protein